MEDLGFKSIIGRLTFSDENAARVVEVTTVEVTTLDSLRQAVTDLQNADYIAFYDKDNDVYLAGANDKQYRVAMSDSFLDELTEQSVYDEIAPLLSGSVPKAVYDWKTTRHRLAKTGVDIVNVRYDVAIMRILWNIVRLRMWNRCVTLSTTPSRAQAFTVLRRYWTRNLPTAA